MPRKRTLKTLAENLIRESREPFSVDEYIEWIEKQWRRRIAPATLEHLRDQLSNHSHVIGISDRSFLPYQAVLDRVGHLPLDLRLSKVELEKKVMIPGHRLIPFISPDLEERELTFLDPEGGEIPRIQQSFFIEDVIHHYQYANEKHFPYQIKVNQWMPEKSTLRLTVWDIREWLERWNFQPEDGLQVRLVDFSRGVYRLEFYSAAQRRQAGLKTRAFGIALENKLIERQREDGASAPRLEKQLLKALFHLEDSQLNLPAFSLTDFVESLERIAVVRNEEADIHFGMKEASSLPCYAWEELEHTPQGRTGSLDDIFQDMGLAFSESEFKAILYSMMGTEEFDLESVFDLLFGAKKDCFYDQKQHQAFYRLLRKLLNLICDELKGPEPHLVSRLRNKIVYIKLRLIEMLRYIEAQEVHLQDLPEEVLGHLADLDDFCLDGLGKLADRPNPPDVKAIQDMRLALQMLQPNLDYLEETIFYRLGIY